MFPNFNIQTASAVLIITISVFIVLGYINSFVANVREFMFNQESLITEIRDLGAVVPSSKENGLTGSSLRHSSYPFLGNRLSDKSLSSAGILPNGVPIDTARN